MMNTMFGRGRSGVDDCAEGATGACATDTAEMPAYAQTEAKAAAQGANLVATARERWRAGDFAGDFAKDFAVNT
ncbi:MAG: hypothetical protein ACKO3W_10835, partial [bacterium]